MSAAASGTEPGDWVVNVSHRHGLSEAESNELLNRVVGETWSPDDEPGELSHLQAAGIEIVCRQALNRTWPGAPQNVLDQATDLLLPSLLHAGMSGLFDVGVANDAGGALQQLFKEYQPDLSFLKPEELRAP